MNVDTCTARRRKCERGKDKVRGKLISVGGGDRAQVDALAGQLVAWLHGRGVQVVQFSLPTRGPVGVLIRLQAQSRLQLDPVSLALLWTADRLDLLSREGGIVAQLQCGMTVVCAQYGWGDGCGAMTLDPGWLERINARCLRPDLSLCVEGRESLEIYQQQIAALFWPEEEAV
jgi:thymidylate kinase